jgi:hypothetical protein
MGTENQNNQQQDQQQQETTQDDEIAAMFTDDPGPAETPAEGDKPDADKPSEGDDKATPAEQAKPEGDKQEPDDKGQPESDAKKPEDGDDKSKAPGDKQEPAAQAAPPDPESVYKVITSKGARDVKAKDLITTYQQFSNLQEQHVHVKPLLEFARSENMPQDLIWPIFAYGLEAYKLDMATANQQGGGGQPAPAPQQDPNQYSGPFKDAQEEAYFRDRDPDMYRIIKNLHGQLLEKTAPAPTNRQQPGAPPLYQQPAPTRQPAQDPAQMESIRQDYHKKINDWASGYSDYFKADPATGKSEPLDHFLAYLADTYPHWRVSELTPERLSAAFAGFDPGYYNQTIAARAKAKEQELRDQNRQMFAEGGDVRSPAPKLTDQEQEIADMAAEFGY